MIVTLLTDFGTADYFVGAMKGVILSRAPAAAVVDLSHEVPAHDVAAGAFTLLAALDAFPAGTVHVVVVDPGVGSARRGIAAAAGGHLLVGPDNGLLSWALERLGAPRVFHLAEPGFFRPSVSATFHGRDVFAPVAAALATGTPPEALGPEVDDWTRLPPLAPERGEGVVRGRVLHVDRFGNLVTSLSRADLPSSFGAEGRVRLVVGEAPVERMRRFYADAAPGAPAAEPFAIWGSAGFLEVSLDGHSAARALGAAAGKPVEATLA